MEVFPEDGNYVYTIAQLFPRMCVYDDYEGWQNKQFLGRSEFALPFGDYKVSITVPADHIVGATGSLKNPTDVLSKAEVETIQCCKDLVRQTGDYCNAGRSNTKREDKVNGKEDVGISRRQRSRLCICQLPQVHLGCAGREDRRDKTPLAMSYYPKEGNPLWEKESTKVVTNTIEVYSKFTLDYPYPVAIACIPPASAWSTR